MLEDSREFLIVACVSSVESEVQDRQVTDPHWTPVHKLGSVKFHFIIAVNILAAVGATILLGSTIGWMAAGRVDAGTLQGDILPFFQFIAFAAFADYAMWAMASRGIWLLNRSWCRARRGPHSCHSAGCR